MQYVAVVRLGSKRHSTHTALLGHESGSQPCTVQ